MASTALSQALSIPSSKTRLSFLEAPPDSGAPGGGRKQGRTSKAGDLEAVDASEFFTKRASQIDQERKLFGDFVRFVTPNEAELLNLQWDERHFQEEQESLESEVQSKEAEIASVREEIARKMRALHDAKVAQRVRQAQIVRLSSLSRPVDNDTTYLVSDRGGISLSLQLTDGANAAGAAGADPDLFQKTYIKIPRSGELTRIESQLSLSFSNVSRSCKQLAEKLAEFKEPAVSAFVAHSPAYRVAADLLAKLEKLDLQNLHLVREYLKLRLDVMVAQRQNVQSQETLRQCRDAYQKSEYELHEKLSAGIEAMKSKFDKDLLDATRQLDTQMEAVSEKLAALKVAKQKVKRLTNADDEKTREELAIWREKYRKVSERYRLEMEGYDTEMAILRSRLKKVHSVAEVADAEVGRSALTSYTDDDAGSKTRDLAGRRSRYGEAGGQEPVRTGARVSGDSGARRPASASAAMRRAHEHRRVQVGRL